MLFNARYDYRVKKRNNSWRGKKEQFLELGEIELSTYHQEMEK
jgi:hypothetical protein